MTLNQMNLEEKQRLVNSIPRWRHSIDCGDGIITPGRLKEKITLRKLKRIKLPPLKGKSVLDIGAWDGFYSFKVEEMGASKVVALDYFSWLRNGKKAFDTACLLRNSKVESVKSDFMKLDLKELGLFDIVLFLGVLYHLEEPFRAIRRLHSVTRELAIIDTEAVYIPGQEEKALFEFYPGTELNNDSSNWWAPNLKGLESACLAAGFKRIKCLSKYPPDLENQDNKDNQSITGYRLAIHAYK
ncbi:MAG: DUF1698 domain-containing protein [Xenococcaceae cyanobacterium MO_188.B19]|nr:DUF1698 domain-containing protein [Xenococcaceae cyanobacterium MO_188.B19]